MVAFWLGLYSARRLYEPAIQAFEQRQYECSYHKDSASKDQIENHVRLESCNLALDDARDMLGTCKRVLSFADEVARPKPEPEKKPGRRWKRARHGN